MSSGERPEITAEHARFNERVVTAAQHMTALSLTTIHDRFGVPPFEHGRKILEDFAGLSIYFSKDGSRPRSRRIDGSIAGCDSFTINRIALPEEGWANRTLDITYPGRILELSLLYGLPGEALEQKWDCRLYSGRDMPPIFVDEAASVRLNKKVSPDALGSLSYYMNELPETALHFPEASELQVVRAGLAIVQQDINLMNLVHNCRLAAWDEEQHDPSFHAEKMWFWNAENRM